MTLQRPETRTCALNRVRKASKEWQPTHLVTLLVRDAKGPYRPQQIDPSRHMRLAMEDTLNPMEDYAPAAHHAESLFHLAQSLRPDARVLVHCQAGINRSTAAAILILAFTGQWTYDEAASAILAQEPRALPNQLLLSHGRDLLRRISAANQE